MIIIAGLVAGQLIYYGYVYFEKKSNHKKVMDMVDNDITYEWDNLDEQLKLVLEWIDKKHLSKEDWGRLYERAALIYQQQGADMTYYRYLGYALYFLENSDDKDYTVNIYLDLANLYLNNFSIAHAGEMMEKAQEASPFENLENLQVKSYAYRLKGIIEAVKGNYADAEELLNKSLEIVSLSDTGIFEESYIAMSETWLANVYFETGRMDECAKILQKYEDSPLLTQDIYRKILLRDFVVPYYQTKTSYYVALAYKSDQEGNTADFRTYSTTAETLIGTFMDVCENNGYERHELGTLLRMQSEYPVDDPRIQSMLYEKLDSLYTNLMNEQNENYASIIDSQIDDSKNNMAENVERQQNNTYRNILATFIAIIMFIIVIFVIIAILYSNVDGLSSLLNRKKLDKKLGLVKRKGVNYTIIMIDMDNFKNVNDTYGHLSGDLVIQRLGELLSREVKDDVKAYRYGGEEFVILITKDLNKQSEIIAERIRRSMEQERWEFCEDLVITLSIGIATGHGNEDVLKKADENLYKSKQSGKNKITM